MTIEEEIRLYFRDLKNLKANIRKEEKHLINTIKDIVNEIEKGED